MAEMAYLKEVFGRRPDEVIARELGRPVESISKMAVQVFRGPRVSGEWSEEERHTLRECLGATEITNIALILRRSESDVRRAIEGMETDTKRGRWTPEEVAVLKRLYGSRMDEDLAKVLGRNVGAIRRQARKLHLAKDKTFLRRVHQRPATRMPRWSEEEVRTLVRLYSSESNLEIAEHLGRSVKSVVSKAHELSLKKSSERLQAMGRDNVSLRVDRRS